MSNELAVASNTTPATFGGSMSPAIMVMLDDKLFERTKLVAKYMAAADGFTPKHLIGKTEACFAVVTRSLTWKLDPFAVAQATYAPADGKVGFEGKLCQAIIENSGKVRGGVSYEPYGDWSKVQGKFEFKTNNSGKKYPVATYTDSDEQGLGVIARAQVDGEEKPREFRIDLRQAQPRNSTLWATDPLTQLKYRAARGLGNLAMPGIFMGVPFDREDYYDNQISANMIDVTPNAVVTSLTEQIEAEKAKADDVTDAVVESESGDVQDKQQHPANQHEGEPVEAVAPEFNINAYRVTTQAGAKDALKALCAILEQLPEGDRAGYFMTHSGMDLVSMLNRHGLGAQVDKITALGIKLPKPAA